MNITNLLFSFNGRINRAKYWLASLIIGIVPTIVILLIAAISSEVVIVLFIVWAVIVIWPSLAITAKRWHDRDKIRMVDIDQFYPNYWGTVVLN